MVEEETDPAAGFDPPVGRVNAYKALGGMSRGQVH